MDKRDTSQTGSEARPRRKTAAPTRQAPEARRADAPVDHAAPNVSDAAAPADRPRGKAARPKAAQHKSGPQGKRPPRLDRPAKPALHAARRGALSLLEAVRHGATLFDAAAALGTLTPQDRARAQRLAATTLRHRGRTDAVLAPLLHRTPRPDIADLLALATTEMLALDEAPHGAVNAAVAIARIGDAKTKAAAGMVNAVLRRAADSREIWDAASPARLPDWLRSPIAAMWGEPVAQAIEAAHERTPPLDLTAKPGATPPGELLPTGSHRLPPGTQITALPGYEDGDWWVQDAAAALPVRLLDPQPGETVADLCAAPGGKTMQLAAAGATVTAIDLSPARLERVAENLTRTGLMASLVAADALDWRPDAPLDAVLLDAPCSATGTIRRHPELPLIRDGAMIPDLTRLQAALIDHALSVLKPGGRLIYAVCSLHPAEGERQLAAALTRHPGLTVEPPTDLPADWTTADGAIRTRPDHWPDLGGLDGFFIVRLRKP